LFRLLVQAGDKGMAAGAIAEKLGVPSSSLSFHLAQLRNAGLILQERQHRSLIYRANYPAMNALVAYLLENCCAGSDCGVGAACEPLAQGVKPA
jgi:DNA-binding transcriptional ArsR family regulator